MRVTIKILCLASAVYLDALLNGKNLLYFTSTCCKLSAVKRASGIQLFFPITNRERDNELGYFSRNAALILMGCKYGKLVTSIRWVVVQSHGAFVN